MTCKTKLDESEGIPVGFGIKTGIPVRMYMTGAGNNSVEITGGTGSGKTFAMKLIARRLACAHKSTPVFVIDPFDEYGELANDCGLDSVVVGDSVPGFGDRSIIALKDKCPDDPERAKLLVSALKKAWKRVHEMPSGITKAIIIDDAHFLLNDEEGQEVISTIVRMGRKLNAVVLVAVQRVQDIEGDLVGNFGTRVFMRLAKLKEDGEMTGLDAADVEQISGLERGCGLITTADHRIYARFG